MNKRRTVFKISTKLSETCLFEILHINGSSIPNVRFFVNFEKQKLERNIDITFDSKKYI